MVGAELPVFGDGLSATGSTGTSRVLPPLPVTRSTPSPAGKFAAA